MATVLDLVNDIKASISGDVSGLIVAKWIDNRYQEMVSNIRFRNLRKVGELVIPGVVTYTEEIGFNADSTQFGGSGTTFTTDFTGNVTDWYLYCRDRWQQLASVSTDTVAYLTTEFQGEQLLVYEDSKAVKRYHSLASDARWLGSFVHPRLRKELTEVSHEELDITAPARELVSHHPEYDAQVGTDSNDYISVEIYPSPAEAELIRYVYWSLPSTLSMGSTIPPQIDGYTLKEGALIDTYRFEKLRQINLGNAQAAGVLANEEAKQRTIFRRAVEDAKRTQLGVDDTTFILRGFGGRSASGDIISAREHALADATRWG